MTPPADKLAEALLVLIPLARTSNSATLNGEDRSVAFAKVITDAATTLAAYEAERATIQSADGQRPASTDPLPGEGRALAPAPITDLDRAWRAVDALGGTWPAVERGSRKSWYQDGYREALDEACTAIEKLGGRDKQGSAK